MRWAPATQIACALLLGAALCRAGELTHEQCETLRTQAVAALSRGDYNAMATACRSLADAFLARIAAAEGDRAKLAAFTGAELDDLLYLGHAHQLAGRWREAVAGYGEALDALDAAIGRAQPSRTRELLLGKVAALGLLVGRLQREELDDAKAAVAAFARATAHVPLLGQPSHELLAERERRIRESMATGKRLFAFRRGVPPSYALEALREQAETLERTGAVVEAIEAWNRVALARWLCGGSHGPYAIVDIARLVRSLPREAGVPPTPQLFVLTPESPRQELKLAEPRVLARSFAESVHAMGAQWRFAFAAPPGLEFAAVTLTCELERIQERGHPRVGCSAPRPGRLPDWEAIGTVHWPHDAPPGRKTFTERFPVPPDVGLSYVTPSTRKGHDAVHTIRVEAELRAHREERLRPMVRLQCEVLPKGGQLTCAGRPMVPGGGFTDLEPGRYDFAYAALGRKPVQLRAQLAGGATYGLFLNLDSPFRWALTGLRGFDARTAPRSTLARLPDGRWLVAFGAKGDAILLSTSADRVAWVPPWPLPHGSIFPSTAPALFTDDDGSVWLAYLSSRLYIQSRGSFGYLVWLTRTRDGRAWSRPRPVLVGQRDSGWKPLYRWVTAGHGSPQMLRGPKGQRWLFCGQYAGSAPSLAELRRLESLEFPPARVRALATSSHVAIDGRGTFHVVFVDTRRRLAYCRSTDGRSWSAPSPLELGARRSSPSGAQLILDGDRAALLREESGVTWLHRGVVSPKPAFGPGIQVANARVPLRGSRAWVGPDGEVALLAGLETVWLLRAPRSRLARPAEAEF